MLKMIITHFVLGFIISYLGFTPPSMLNLTAGRIFLEKDKKSAYQFTLGVSIVVFLQFFLSYAIVACLNQYPNILFWIKNVSVVIFILVSIFFLTKGLTKDTKRKQREHKNNFIYGLSLSFINMFSIPFFAVSYSLLTMEGFVKGTSTNIIIFAFGVFFGVIAILISYVFLMKKFKRRMLLLTKYINTFIGVITGFLALYSLAKLYL